MSQAPIDPASPNVVATKWWHKLDDARVQCDVCPRACKMGEGQRGACFVRGNLNGEVVLTTYGRSSGFCIDPIEKKPLNHFLPGTSVLSFGTAGCNLACKFCQNWDISKSREMDRLMDQASPLQLAMAAEQHGCRSVAYTYNDPVVFLEYAIDVAKACRQRNIKNVAVTAGYICDDVRPEFFEFMDAVNVDLKAFTDRFYHKLCGAHIQPVLDTLDYLAKTDIWFEITTLLIPGQNDGDEEIRKLCQWLLKHVGSDYPLHFSAFHPDFKMTDVAETPASTLRRARDIAMAEGLHYVYVGNVHDLAGDSTYCPDCGENVIGRDWYELQSWQLADHGHCIKCGHQIAGVFENLPGNWGRRRLPVTIS